MTKKITFVRTYQAEVPEDMDLDMIKEQIEIEESHSDFTIHVTDYDGDNAFKDVFFSEQETDCYEND